MTNATVSIVFKLESGADGIQKLTLNTKDLKAVLGATATEAKNSMTKLLICRSCNGCRNCKNHCKFLTLAYLPSKNLFKRKAPHWEVGCVLIFGAYG